MKKSPTDQSRAAATCSPPLDCSKEDFRAFIATLEVGERVIECGQSGMQWETGIIVISRVPEHGKCVKWNTNFREGRGMVTSITGGTRRLVNAPLPERVSIQKSEWEKLDVESRQFLTEAENGGMRYLAENGEVCAWGPAYAGLFSMDVEAKPDPDGYLVTLANDQAQPPVG